MNSDSKRRQRLGLVQLDAMKSNQRIPRQLGKALGFGIDYLGQPTDPAFRPIDMVAARRLRRERGRRTFRLVCLVAACVLLVLVVQLYA